MPKSIVYILQSITHVEKHYLFLLIIKPPQNVETSRKMLILTFYSIVQRKASKPLIPTLFPAISHAKFIALSISCSLIKYEINAALNVSPAAIAFNNNNNSTNNNKLLSSYKEKFSCALLKYCGLSN